MRLRIAVFSILSVLAAATMSRAADLTKIERLIRKEPAYTTKPRYCLLVLGSKAETKVWLVIDDSILYVDRNANGDLTEPGEKFATKDRGSSDTLGFDAGELLEADGKTRHSKLIVYQYFHLQHGHLVNTVGVLGQTTNGEEGGSFSESTKDAPIIHLNGPLTMRIHSAVVEYRGGARVKEFPFELDRGESLANLHVQVGTPGLGKGTFAALGVEKGFPADLHPKVEMLLPNVTDPKQTIKTEFYLKERC